MIFTLINNVYLSSQSRFKSSNMHFATERTFSRSVSKPNSFLTGFDLRDLIHQFKSIFLLTLKLIQQKRVLKQQKHIRL